MGYLDDYDFGMDYGIDTTDFAVDVDNANYMDMPEADFGFEFNLDDYVDFDDATWNTEFDTLFESSDYMQSILDEEGNYDPLGEEGFMSNLEIDELSDSEFEELYGTEKPGAEEGEGKGWMDKFNPFGSSEEEEENGVSADQKAALESKGYKILGEFNGKTWALNPFTGRPEVLKEDSGFFGGLFSNKGLLSGMATMGAAGLSYLGQSDNIDVQKEMFEDKMRLEREMLAEKAREFDVRQGGSGGSGTARPDANAAHNSALAALANKSRVGDFTKR
jgi:hypothetical protein